MADVRETTSFHDGFEDGLEPVETIDLAACDSVDDILKAMSHTAFGGRNLGEAADVLEAMFKDKDCYTVLTLSGALTVAKMQLIFTELVDRGWVNAICSTGALIAHGFIEGTGMKHFKHKPDLSDVKLYELGYDRVYDTLELEKNLYEAQDLITDIFAKDEYHEKTFTSPELCHIMGQYLLDQKIGGRSVLKSAVEKNVPIYIPALNDSELGLDLISLRYPSDKRQHKEPVHIEHKALADVEHFADIVKKQKRLGIFTIGGGVPRNWAQQIGPFLELKYEHSTSESTNFPRYDYGVRICPEPVHWGGLSGCTYSEGMSWGKFNPKGKFAEVHADATICLPFLVKALMQRLP